MRALEERFAHLLSANELSCYRPTYLSQVVATVTALTGVAERPPPGGQLRLVQSWLAALSPSLHAYTQTVGHVHAPLCVEHDCGFGGVRFLSA